MNLSSKDLMLLSKAVTPITMMIVEMKMTTMMMIMIRDEYQCIQRIVSSQQPTIDIY